MADRFLSKDRTIMPAEYEQHRATLMLFPYRPDTWREEALPARMAFSCVANIISLSEKVYMGVRKEDKSKAARLLSPAVELIELEYNDAWMRDAGPTFVRGGENELFGIDWNFNAWGGEADGLYPDWEADNRLAGQILERFHYKKIKLRTTIEGGALSINGRGTLIAVEECVLNTNRNKDITKSEMEALFNKHLGIEKVIWLPLGVYNDETDGHTDNMCCFVSPDKVLLTWTDDPGEPQYERSNTAYNILKSATDAEGNRLNVEKIQQPGPLYLKPEESAGIESGSAVKRPAGTRLAASYINFYITNRIVVMPVFNDRHDKEAVETIKRNFPNRRVIPVYSREILIGGGNIHCITQQIPL